MQYKKRRIHLQSEKPKPGTAPLARCRASAAYYSELTSTVSGFAFRDKSTTVSTCAETPLLMSCVNGNLSFIFDVNGNISFTPNLVGIKILLISPAVVELLCHIAETFA